MRSQLTIQFFSVGCSNATALRFLGTDSRYHNILIDAGYSSTYASTIRKKLLAIQK